MTYPSNPALDGEVDGGSLEVPLTHTSQNGCVASIESRPFHNVRSLSIHSLLLVLATTFFGLWINFAKHSCPLDPLLTYSPANEAVQYVEKWFDGSINSSVVPRVPRLTLLGRESAYTMQLSRELFLMIDGRDTIAAVRFQPEDGGGYMAQIDAYHHIHCLDMLRKYVRRDYYANFDVSFGAILRPHLAHCVEIVRQKLMCTADLTMVTYDWIPNMDAPQPNRSALHQCVDFERIIEWSEAHNPHVPRSRIVKWGDATEFPEDTL